MRYSCCLTAVSDRFAYRLLVIGHCCLYALGRRRYVDPSPVCVSSHDTHMTQIRVTAHDSDLSSQVRGSVARVPGPQGPAGQPRNHRPAAGLLLSRADGPCGVAIGRSLGRQAWFLARQQQLRPARRGPLPSVSVAWNRYNWNIMKVDNK